MNYGNITNDLISYGKKHRKDIFRISHSLVRRSPSTLVLGGIAVAGGLLLKKYFDKRKVANGANADTQFTGAAPGEGSAMNEVIGGHPEDMNGMPSAFDTDVNRPVYDGSDIGPDSNPTSRTA